MIAWVRIQSGDLKEHEWTALRAVAAQQPVIPYHLRNDVPAFSALVNLALADLIEMRNTSDGDRLRAGEIEFAYCGSWSHVTLTLTDTGRAQLTKGN